MTPGEERLLHSVTEVARPALKHFVSVSYRVEFPGIAPQSDVMSCFVVRAFDAYWLITAGHNVENVKKWRGQGASIHSFRINDSWASEVHAGNLASVLPFEISHWIGVDVEGTDADFGAIFLPEFIFLGLRKVGIQALEESEWNVSDPEEFEAFAIIGIPRQTVSSKPLTNAKNLLEQSVVILPAVRWREAVPPSLVWSPRRLFAQIATHSADPVWRAMGGDINGISGGPVIGVRLLSDGSPSWSVLGIQIAWDRPTRIIAAGLLAPAMALFGFALNKAMREMILTITDSGGDKQS